MRKRTKKITRKKRTKKTKRNTGLTFKKLVRAVNKVKRKFKRRFEPKLRLELDIPTSTKVTSLHPVGYEFKSQVFIKDNKKKQILTGPIDFDHAVAIIGFYNEHPEKELPKWLTRLSKNDIGLLMDGLFK